MRLPIDSIPADERADEELRKPEVEDGNGLCMVSVAWELST